jgi:antitoxin component YwqK of YwqJK toxin-antitoxin module
MNILLTRSLALLTLTVTLSYGSDIKVHEEHYEDGTLKLRYEHYDATEESRHTVPSQSSRVYHGQFHSYHSSGQDHKVGSYERGLRTGTWTNHRKDGSVLMQGSFVAGTGTMTGTWSNGTPRSEASWRGGLRHGLLRDWYANGAEKVKIVFESGKVISWQEWYSDQTLKAETQYENGRVHGTKREWYPNGTLRLEANYDAGRREGPFNIFYRDGSDSLRCHYESGELSGSRRSWYANGNLQFEAEYDLGKSVGVTRAFSFTGVDSLVKVHLSGTTSVLIETYDASGNLKMRWVSDDDQIWAWEKYDGTGNIDTSSGEPIGELLSRVENYEARVEQEISDRQEAYDRQQWYEDHKSKIGELRKHGITSVSDAMIYIVGTWAGGDSHSGSVFVSRYVVAANGNYRAFTVSARATDSIDRSRLKSKSWGTPQSRGRWNIEEKTYSDTGDRYFFFRFIGEDGGGLVIDENGDVAILRNHSLYRVENSSRPYDCYGLYDHQL